MFVAAGLAAAPAARAAINFDVADFKETLLQGLSLEFSLATTRLTGNTPLAQMEQRLGDMYNIITWVFAQGRHEKASAIAG